jgi:hypothetical protein
MSQEVQVFDQAKADVSALLAKYEPLLSIEVTDPFAAQKAIDVAQDLKGALKRIDTLRTQAVAPLNQRVKKINEAAKEISAPLTAAQDRIQEALNDFAERQRQAALAEQRRLEAERREQERLARQERERVEAELAEKQEAEAEAIAKANSLFGTGEETVEAVNAEVDKKLSEEWKAEQERLDQEDAIRRIEHGQKTYDINQLKVKNTRVNVIVHVLDLALVPKEFLLIEVNEKKAKDAYKLGLPVPGLKFEERANVAIGANTYMPLARK